MAKWLVIAVVLIAAGWWLWSPKAPVVAPTQNPEIPISGVPEPTESPVVYSLADVAGHAQASSCWTAINGLIYDLTPWIKQHPGGDKAILDLCGRDGSADFNKQHGGQRAPEKNLEGFKIGTLLAQP